MAQTGYPLLGLALAKAPWGGLLGASGLGRMLRIGAAPNWCLAAHLWDWTQEPQVPGAHIKQFRAALMWTRVVDAPGCAEAKAWGT